MSTSSDSLHEPHRYSYIPLSSDVTSSSSTPSLTEAIRLLTIEPNSREDEILIKVEHSTVTDDYNAISYMWGPPEPFRFIYINGHHLIVRDNIYRFLQHQIRHGTASFRKFWIDSICINQDDLEEKSQQVSMMDKIFSKAAHVLIWLGDASENESLLYYAEDRGVNVHEIEWSDFLNETTFGQSNSSDEDAETHLGLITNNDYWTRLWIIPETVLARNLYVVFGRTQISLKAVKNMRDFCSVDWQTYLAGRRPRLMTSLPPELSEPQNALYSIAHWKQSSQDSDTLRQSGTLMELLNRFGRQKCANSRDKIYGLLSLTNHTKDDFPIDYTCTKFDLFARVVRFMQQEVQSL